MKKIIISGATSGLGLEALKQLHAMGHYLIAIGRDRIKLEQLKEQFSERLSFYVADYANLISVADAANKIRQEHQSLDVLVNNTAVNLMERKTTRQGLEMHFGVNYLSHFYMTNLLLPLLKHASQGRVINVGAVQLAKKFLWNDFQLEKGWKNMTAVTNAKLGIFMFSQALDRRLAGTNVTVNILDPGLVRTPYHDDSNPILKLFIHIMGKTAEACVRDNYVWLATDASLNNTSGKFYSYKKEKQLKGDALEKDKQERLWQLSEELSKLEASI